MKADSDLLSAAPPAGGPAPQQSTRPRVRPPGATTWSRYLVGGLAGIAVYAGLTGHPAGQSVVFIVANLSVLVALWAGVHRNRPQVPVAWRLFFLSVCCFGVGTGVWGLFREAFPTPPSPADGFILVSYALQVGAIGILISRSPGGREWGGWIDVALIAGGLGLLAGSFLVDFVDQSHPSGSSLFILLAYPFADVVLASLLIRMVFVRPARTGAFWLLVASVAVQLAADGWYARSILVGTFDAGDWIFAGWILSWVLLGAAALHPTMRTLGEPSDGGEAPASPHRVPLIAAAIVAAPVAFLARGLEPEDAVIVASASVLLIALISVRMWGLFARMSRAQRDLRAAEVRYRTIVERVPAITYSRAPGSLGAWRFVSPQIEAVLGFTPEAWTRDGGLWGGQLHPSDRQRVLTEVAAAGRSHGLLATEYRLLHRDGHVVWVRDEGVFVRAEEWLLQGILYDVTEQKKTERRLTVQHDLTMVLAEAPNLAEAAPHILQALAETLECDVSILWVPDRTGEVLRCANVWHSGSIDGSELVPMELELAFPRGVALPGEVWQQRTPIWIPDLEYDERFVRGAVVARLGLHGAFAFPISIGDEVVAVIELFSREAREPDESLLETMIGVGTQIGQFVDRKRSEEALRESESRKAAVLRSALDCVITIDDQGRILEFNPAAERTFGYAQDDVMGKAMADLIVPPALRDRHRKAFQRHLDTGESAIIGTRVELTAMRSDGTEFPVELTVVRVEGSQPPVFTGYLRDITERQRTEDALRDSEERHRLMFEGNPQPMWVMDKETLGFLGVNEAALRQYGYSADEFRSMTVKDIRPPSEVPKLLESLAKAFEEPEGQQGGHRHQRKDGTIFEVDIRWRDFTFGGREARLVVAEDLTQRQVAEDAKRRLVAVLEATSDLVSFADREGRVTYINDAGRAMLGITDAKLESLRVRDLHPAWARRQIAQEATPTALRDGTWNGESALVHRDGREIPVSQVIVAHRTASGELDFFSTTCRDITAQKTAADERELLLEMERAGRSELEAGRRRLELLDGASRLLGSSLDYEKTLANVVRLVVPGFADLCSIQLVSDDGTTLEHSEMASSDPSKLGILEEWQAAYQWDPARAHGTAKVVRTKRPELLSEVSDAHLAETASDGRQLGFLRALEIRSAITVPLLASGDRCIGAITMLSSSPDRRYSEADLVMATDLAIRCALAIDNARLYKEARQAVKENEENLALVNALFATAPIGVVLVDRDLRVVRANDEAAGLHGKRPEEMVGASVRSLIPTSNKTERAIKRVLRAGEAALGIEVTAETPAEPGRQRHWLTSYYPVRAEGKVAGIGVVMVDITERKEAEDALRLSEGRWKSIFATTGVGITLATPEGRFIEVNPAYSKLLGYTEEELLSMSWPELTHPEDVAANWKHLDSLRKGRPRSGSFQKRVRRKDGTYLTVLMDVARMFGMRGELLAQVAITQDVTAQRQAEERLRQSEERLRLALEAGEMGTWSNDPETKRETWDETMEAIFGLAPGAFPGTADAFLEHVHPDDRARVESTITSPTGARELEYRIVRLDGSVRTVLTRGNVLTDEEGRVAGDVGVAIDITERKRAERDLERKERRFRALIENSSDSIVLIGLDGKVGYVSPHGYRMLGYTEEETVGSDAFAWLHPDDQAKAVDQFQEVIANPGRPVTALLRVRRSDGEWRWIEGVVRNLLADPSVEAIVVNSRDVTERQEAEDRVRESEERLRFALDAGRMGAWYFDFATQTLTWDAAMRSIFNLPPDAPIRSIDDYMRWVHPGDVDRVTAHAASVIKKHSTADVELRIVRPDGSERWIWEGMRLVRDPGGSIAGLAGIIADVTDRKRTQDELMARVRQQAALAELFQSALSGADVRSLMDEACVVLARTLDIEYSEVLELQPDRNVLTMVSGVGWRDGTVGTVEVPVEPGTQAGQALLTRAPAIVTDLDTDTRFARSVSLREHAIASGASVPIIGQEGPLGVLAVFSSSTREFDPDDLNFLRSVAGLVADGMDRLRAEEELRRTLTILRATDEERRKLLSRLVKVQEEERERIAADIHDDSIQVMTALSLRLQMLKEELTDPEQLARLIELEKVLEKTIGRLRHLLFELRPPALDREGLTPALRDYLQKMAEEDGASFSLEDRLVAEPETDARVIVYRIAQEALVNVRKHARASNVDVSLDELEGGVFVTIQDDGRGFSPDIAKGGLPGHLGLTAMRERAEMAGGWLKVISTPGAGTSVQFWVPAEKVRT